jgi:hypothetical protein
MPNVTAADLDEDVGELTTSLDQFYSQSAVRPAEFPRSLDGDLRSIFADPRSAEGSTRRPVSELIRRLEPELTADVYRWTGYFPERTRPLLRHLDRRADQLEQVYPEERELKATVALTTLVTAWAMNHVQSDG